MAKKRKAARPSAAKGAKKKAARPVKKAARPKKKPVMRVAQAAYTTGLEKPEEVDFRPLKEQISAHIARLGSAKVMTPAIENALRSLRQVQTDLSSDCSPTMIIPTP
jgi:hypothetical protein